MQSTNRSPSGRGLGEGRIGVVTSTSPDALLRVGLSQRGLNILDASKSAAQRRKNVATAAGRGLWCCGGMSPFRGERVTSRDTFRRTPFRTSSTTRSTPPEMFSFDDVQLDS